MFSSNYERVQTHDDDDHVAGQNSQPIPNSPPPSFRSRNSSRRNSAQHDHHHDEDADRDIDDAFAAPSDDESDHDGPDADRRRLVQSSDPDSPEAPAPQAQPPRLGRRVTEINMFLTGAGRSSNSRAVGGGSSANDGVFANISAKPTRGEELEEKPPTYEQAAADSAPPYWETSILAPGAFNSDDIFVDGLVVGSLFSFVWNALISMSFQLIGFLLTYLLHTTHAAKHGSRAGLGITLIQYGFTFRSVPSDPVTGVPANDPSGTIPSDPNAHDFNPSKVAGGVTGVEEADGLRAQDWISYGLMIVGWFILIRSVSQFIRARRQEMIIRGTNDRGLGTAVVASNETPEQAV
ncbi:hypothetical protein E4T49_02184 [Aureobasidium sp. EXF-10728]|nr:hypothetical protein E4T49_02184 [Aureobasidium sp. EXF-10728]